MKVQGVDPTILNRIQGETSKQAVQEAKQARISGERQRQKETGQEAGDKPDRERLAAAVQRLNKAAEELNIPLHFQLAQEEEQPVVLVIDREKRQVLRAVSPARVLEILTQWQYMLGLLVDQKI
ncbi:MAG: flagellar protein FlaG [Firmicutes bacterium]|nr:flagellar protein FlaG [Bacillota bacterium]